MATQGGLGWPKDSAPAPHEELREAALSCCPKLIKLTNKMTPHFYLLLVFGEGRWYILDPGKQEQTNVGLGKKERANWGQD